METSLPNIVHNHIFVDDSEQASAGLSNLYMIIK